MNPSTSTPRAVLLPGSGSDAVFVRAVFGPALAAVGVALVTPEPDPADPTRLDPVASGLAALDDAAARPGPLLVGGVSLGAAVATGWALAHPGRVDGVLLAMPAWWGGPDGAPAAAAAAASAAALRGRGLDAVLAEVAATAPGWVSRELARAWVRQGAALPAALEATAVHRAPELTALPALDVPVGIAAVSGDPLHPEQVARLAAAALPRARCTVLPLAAVGADPARLGAAAVRALGRAGGVAQAPATS